MYAAVDGFPLDKMFDITKKIVKQVLTIQCPKEKGQKGNHSYQTITQKCALTCLLFYYYECFLTINLHAYFCCF
jgi:hypothetical protein